MLTRKDLFFEDVFLYFVKFMTVCRLIAFNLIIKQYEEIYLAVLVGKAFLKSLEKFLDFFVFDRILADVEC